MKNKIFLVAALLTFYALHPLLARADADLVDWGAGMTIRSIGVGTGTDGAAYFDIAEYPASAKGCTWEYYYIDLGTPAGVATYATLLNAYNRGKKLKRLHFLQSITGRCNVNLIELKI